jgi:hypothetical protein
MFLSITTASNFGPLQREDRSAALAQVARRGSIAVGVDGPTRGLHVAGCSRLMRQRRRLRAFFCDDSQVPRGAEGPPASWTTGAHPVRGQPVQNSRPVERKRVGGWMRAVAVRQAFEAARDAHERVVRLDAGAPMLTCTPTRIARK